MGRTLLAIASILLTSTAAFAETIKVAGMGGAMPLMGILGEEFERSNPGTKVVIVPGLGSRGGKKALLAGAVDIAVSADPTTEWERAQGALAIDWARTPFVLVTSRANPVSDLTTGELADIYTGRVTTWPDGSRLRLVLRPEGDSDITVLRRISPAMDQAVTAAVSRPGMRAAVTDSDAAEAVETTPGALGTSTLGQLIAEKRQLKILSVDGVAPGVQTLADGSYKHFKSLQLVTRSRRGDSAQRFIDFVRSDRGRRILERSGFLVIVGRAAR